MYDFSCGVAALTTLFNYQFGRNAKEQKLLLGYLKSLSKKRQNKITELGLSLFELKEIGEYSGFQVYVVRIPFQGLVKTNKPALVYIENEKFKHFAVFRGFKQGKVFLADSSIGNRSILPKDFIKLWKGTTALFLVSNKEKDLNILDIHNKELIFPQYRAIEGMLR
ncbi:C39 family peptidase [Bathymodiolus thermophilus thioautotrophic gill symbiont]|uniref:C39 family peptidase n=1 Tax=Bathymodiolus thermophilus thioautotrophic gill symbiont TaxID=2360 RepID=UPI00214B9657|nr:cysteine peptidase family C39 domain-containing protein [Bathymodiolus thermophilus thioautotrophic gill symbiont]